MYIPSSLNGIFLFDELNCIYPNSSFEYGLDQENWQAIMNECDELYPIKSLSKETESVINEFSKVLIIALIAEWLLTYQYVLMTIGQY